VVLEKTQDWCYHEGSYGHNPEFGKETVLKLDDVIFWKISTSGEAMVPKDVSASGAIGEEHTATLTGETVQVRVKDLKSGDQYTDFLTVAVVYQQFVAAGAGEPIKYEPDYT